MLPRSVYGWVMFRFILRPKVRDLGVFLDPAASMEHHVTSLCKSASFALWKIGKVRKILDESSTEKLVHAFVTSRLDYCNSLLLGLHSNQLKYYNSFRIPTDNWNQSSGEYYSCASGSSLVASRTADSF